MVCWITWSLHAPRRGVQQPHQNLPSSLLHLTLGTDYEQPINSLLPRLTRVAQSYLTSSPSLTKLIIGIAPTCSQRWSTLVNAGQRWSTLNSARQHKLTVIRRDQYPFSLFPSSHLASHPLHPPLTLSRSRPLNSSSLCNMQKQQSWYE